LGNTELKLEIEKEKTRRTRLQLKVEEVRDSRWGKYGVMGAMILLMATILISLLLR